jgi:hypothetical protein
LNKIEKLEGKISEFYNLSNSVDISNQTKLNNFQEIDLDKHIDEENLDLTSLLDLDEENI